MSFITIKFHEILLSGFRRVALTNCFSTIFHFGQISQFKKGVILRKKIEWKSLVDMRIYSLCPSLLQRFTKFCWAVSEMLRWQTVLSSIFHFGQISEFKKGVTPRKKIQSKFPVDVHIYTICPSLLKSFTKFCWAVLKELRWQEKQDWMTDWLTNG